MAIRFIGIAGFDQPRDHRDHLADMLRRARHECGRQHAQRAHVVKEKPLVARRDDRGIDGFRAGGVDDLVVDVGEVACIKEAVGAIMVPDEPREHVEDDIGARIANMRAIVDGRAADIHRHPVGIGRLEQALFARQRVVETDRHCAFAMSFSRWGWAAILRSRVRRASTKSMIARLLALSNGKVRERAIHSGRSVRLP